jgi:hypothetical protein
VHEADAMELSRFLLENAITLVAAILAPTAASSVGVFPRAGPGRALVLGLSTRYWPLRPSIVVSQRTVEVENVKSSLHTLEANQYLVVFGQKGVGKFAAREGTLHMALTMFFPSCRQVHYRQLCAPWRSWCTFRRRCTCCYAQRNCTGCDESCDSLQC